MCPIGGTRRWQLHTCPCQIGALVDGAIESAVAMRRKLRTIGVQQQCVRVRMHEKYPRESSCWFGSSHARLSKFKTRVARPDLQQPPPAPCLSRPSRPPSGGSATQGSEKGGSWVSTRTYPEGDWEKSRSRLGGCRKTRHTSRLHNSPSSACQTLNSKTLATP